MTGQERQALQPWQRPPFEPGNSAAVTHGAYSERRVQPIARQLVDEALRDGDLAYLRAPSYTAALMAWARAEARVHLLTEYVDTEGMKTAKDGRMPILEQLRQWESTAANARARLGLDPVSRARLLKDLAVTGALGGQPGSASVAEAGRALRLASTADESSAGDAV